MYVCSMYLTTIWFVCIIPISYESSFLGHHDFEKEGVSRLSVAINFDEVFKYVMQGHSLPSSKYFGPLPSYAVPAQSTGSGTIFTII